jgi:hypothetical protein
VGRLGEREGSFVFQHGGAIEHGVLRPFGYIVPGSGTGDLRGLRGEASIRVSDVLPPWQPRHVEIRDTAQTLATAGQALFGANYAVDDALIRITPLQIIGWGLDEGAGWSNNRRAERA